MQLCDYGCGQEAKYQFKNGKWCCSSNTSKCQVFRKINSEKLTGIQRSKETKEIISKTSKGRIPWNKGKSGLQIAWNKGLTKDTDERVLKYVNANKGKKLTKQQIEILRKNGKKLKDEKNPFFKKKHREDSKKNMSINLKYSIKDFLVIHPLFSKIEELRYNPDKPGEKEIQVHCKNHNCENSKEKGGWFTPIRSQIFERIRQIENGNGGNYFYCSQYCKNTCILYNLKSDPFKDSELPYTNEEYNLWKQVVLKQDNYECQKCGSKENLHCHHIIPVKIEPMLSLDPSNGIVLCESCHYEVGHTSGTECSTGNLANKICNRGN